MSSNSLQFVLPLSLYPLSLADVGGKGANLARLLHAGFPVPGGFVVTTQAYHRFVEQAGLAVQIDAEIKALDPRSPTGLDAASERIRQAFDRAAVPAEMAAEISAAYDALNRPPVAVRSSATAEDLPDFSFAGQQDTYLNITTPGALLDAVRSCWASLWTARAIGYRARNQIPASGLGLAVVVQAMVPSEASGVMFTAHPLSGRRDELAIDAIFGLGEALVSGQSEPDQYTVRRAPNGQGSQIITRTIGKKDVTIQGSTLGGTETLHADASTRTALSDSQVLALAQMGEAVQAEYGGVPQDIEWALSDQKLYLLQSRAITSLYPTLENIAPAPLQVYASLSAVQGMLDPITPFGRDALRLLAVKVSNMVGFKTTLATSQTFNPAGERLYINLTPLLRNRVGRVVVPNALQALEPNIRAAVLTLLGEPDLQPGRQVISLPAAFRLLRLVVPTAMRMIVTLLRPDWRRRQTIEQVAVFTAEFDQRFQNATTLIERLHLIDDFFTRIPPFMLHQLIPTFAPGVAMLNALYQLGGGTPEDEKRILEITRGMPHNVTTLMDLALWDIASRLQADSESAARFAKQSAPALAADFLSQRLPPAAQQAVASFIKEYGMRGLGEIDIGHPRWREDPTPVMEALQSYMSIHDTQAAPDAAFERGRQRAEQAIDELAESVRGRAKNPLQAHLRPRQIRFAARRVRELAGLRELPKFFAVKLLGMIRVVLLDSGQSLVRAGLLDHPQDIFYLYFPELHEIAPFENNGGWPTGPAVNPTLMSLRERVAARRQVYERELQRRQAPVLLLSDGRALYGGPTSAVVETSADGQVITGSPVSPGLVEGQVRVVLNPHNAGLQPGEIMVCPGTDPSWTPLFLAAGGLVMEVGGLLTHGSVVAREYGIPAVVGVTAATQLLHTGQMIRLNGSTGQIILLDEEHSKGDHA